MTAAPYAGLTASEALLRDMRGWGDRVAFSGYGGTWTYAQALDLIARYQAVYKKHGVKRHERISLLNANRAEAYLAGVAAQALGLSMTPLHTLGSLEDHQFTLEDAEIDYLFVDVDNYADRGRQLAETVERLKTVFTLGPADYGVDIRAEAEAAGAVSPVVEAQSEDPVWISYTGGTTGKPKGGLRTHPSYIGMVTAILADFEFPRDINYLAVAPISHVGGTKLPPTLHRGGRVTFMKGFDAGQVLDTIQRERITMTLLVPTMIYLLLDHPKLEDFDLSSLDYLMYGASPMSPTRLMEGLERIGPVFGQLYGQTEGYPVSFLSKQDHDSSRPDLFASCGRPVANIQVRLLDDDLNEVPEGEPGEICVRGPQVMDCYWNRPEQTEETLKGGWLHTGDVARIDDEGYLYIVDRKKDMIVSGGFNVFPREVEDVLTSHPDVAMAAVIGVPDQKWGEAVKALIVPREGKSPDPQALMQMVKDRKGSNQAPKSIDFVDAIPVTPIGKPDKKAIRAQYWKDSGRMVG
ncbi:MAG: AMP-binding protein [Minwuia sp.]|uniref:AMP-binding protein n=1 Tax=Minwuia sp. TaxID=2493630 RepID=UPI003A875989